MIEVVIASIMCFIATTIDDLFLDMLFFVQATTKKQVQSIFCGKYIGIGILVLLSCLGAYGLQFVSERYIGFLGLIPIAIGIKEGLENFKKSEEDGSEEQPELSKGFLWSVVLVTISSGADNIGVYIPLFANYSIMQMVAVIITFVVMVACWCFLGKTLSSLPYLQKFLLKYKQIIVPVVLICLGVYIILEAI